MRECTCGACQLPPGPHEDWCGIYQEPIEHDEVVELPSYADMAAELPNDWGVSADPWEEVRDGGR